MADYLIKIPEPFTGRGWAKVLSAVDCSKRNGYAFLGEFLNINCIAELPDDAFVMVYGKHHAEPGADLYRHSAGALKIVASARGRDWALRMRDDTAKLIGHALLPAKRDPRLAAFTDKELVAELRRRSADFFIGLSEAE